ncbi:lipoprotein signal peptidase [Leptospira perolatii]|uniref:Lipoprotein signal peptidase n=1 Tax=Leptospira perolatii TaxID=2023191 RepID=A0A2M9ZK96_9LEPT|nr:lipoprotein signal peptidase [Leptospira perolatii]PJZ69351.1 lipoprotein signal peptidase [Leptospira perolatii]PJZ72486.1 lipoprotein signal peptidase [Leptospira perolatii]
MKFFEKKFLEVYPPLFILSVVIGTIIDLATKYIAIVYLQPHRPVQLIGDFFRLTLTFNTGYVMGFFQGNPRSSLIMTGIAIVVLIGYRWKNPNLGHPIGWGLVMSGAFGNFIDKFFVKNIGSGAEFGFYENQFAGKFIGVVDFLDFDWPNWLFYDRWPAFNFADSCVSVGLVLLILTMKLEEEGKKA